MTTKTREVVYQIDVYKTTDYKQFKTTTGDLKTIPGNRDIDMGHVKYLAKRIEKNDLLSEFPIALNDQLEIIDGQHRLLAAELLGRPIYFLIKTGANIDTVMAINTGAKNWTPRNFAKRYAAKGDINYVNFLKLMEETGIQNLHVLLQYSTFRRQGGSQYRAFKDGEFVMDDYELTRQFLLKYKEVSETAGITHGYFALAVLNFMRDPNYDHQRMITKIALYGAILRSCWNVAEYYATLNQIYNS